jgi:hypothetical protein
MRSLGRFSGKMGSNKEFISGVMEGMDPRAIAEAISENAGMMAKVTECLDARAIADSMNDSLGFMAEMMKYIDPKAVAEVLNANERILPRYLECVNPNVFTRSAGTVFTKLRYATYRPPMFQKGGGIEVTEVTEATEE